MSLRRPFQKLVWSLWVHFVYDKVQLSPTEAPPKSHLLLQILIPVPFWGDGVQYLKFSNLHGP